MVIEIGQYCNLKRVVELWKLTYINTLVEHNAHASCIDSILNEATWIVAIIQKTDTMLCYDTIGIGWFSYLLTHEEEQLLSRPDCHSTRAIIERSCSVRPPRSLHPITRFAGRNTYTCSVMLKNEPLCQGIWAHQTFRILTFTVLLD